MSELTNAGDELVIEACYVPAWDLEIDVVVAGLGMAGACAALGASEAGASVFVVERSSGGTGTTASAAAHFYLGGGTPVQVACGFEDDAAEMAKYLAAVSVQPNFEKIALYSNGSVDHFNWLEAQGIPFERSFFPGKAVVQPGRECLIWTGNEQIQPFRDHAKPAPRGHKVAFDGEEGGGALALELLTTRAVERGVDIRMDTRLDALVREDGRIVGARCHHFGQTLYIRATGGVILANGGFARNDEMVAQYAKILQSCLVQGGPYDDGRGIRLGQAAGGAVEHMDGVFMTSPFYPPEKLLKGILVNKDGRRFISEDSYHSRSSAEIATQPDGRCYLVLDVDIFDYPAFAGFINQQLVDGYETVEEMERKLELSPGGLQATMASYNDYAARGEDPDFGKQAKWLKPLTSPPYAAFDLSFGRAYYWGFTLGGLRVSSDGEVLGMHGGMVDGLYAAGACASNIAQDSRGYASGTCLGEASFFGRRAGGRAAQAAARQEHRLAAVQ